VVRSHGGALRRREIDEVPIAVKRIQQHDEKVRIAKAALSFIRDGEVIILDSGSTTAEIALLLQTAPFSRLTVITNALNIAMLLAHVPHVHLIMLGGELRKMSFSLAGLHAEQALEHLQADTLFLGVDSIHTEIGLMTPHVHEAQLNKKMIASSRQIIAVADSTKFQVRSLSLICKLEQIHTLITDDNLDSKIAKEITRTGVRLIKA
jgi:DeoR family transcriptional regulator of aga operon